MLLRCTTKPVAFIYNFKQKPDREQILLAISSSHISIWVLIELSLSGLRHRVVNMANSAKQNADAEGEQTTSEGTNGASTPGVCRCEQIETASCWADDDTEALPKVWTSSRTQG